MINRKYILVLCLALCSMGASASAQLASQPFASHKEADMRSTSAFLAPKSATVSGTHAAAMNGSYGTAGTNKQSFSPLHTTLTKKKRTVKASQFVVSDEVKLPAMAINNRNWENINSSGSNNSTNPVVATPGPRKVSGGGTLPPDPYMVPFGEVPFVFFVLLIAAFALFQRNRAKQ